MESRTHFLLKDRPTITIGIIANTAVQSVIVVAAVKIILEGVKVRAADIVQEVEEVSGARKNSGMTTMSIMSKRGNRQMAIRRVQK